MRITTLVLNFFERKLLSLPIISKKNNSEINKRIILGFFWSLFGSVISRGFTILASIIAARILGKVCFGEFGIIQNTFVVFSDLAGLGLGITATKFISQYRDTDMHRVTSVFSFSIIISAIIGLIFSLIVFIFSSYIAEKILAAPQLALSLKVGAFILFFGAINGVLTGTMLGLEAFRSISLVNVFSGVFNSFLIIILVYYYGVLGGVIALLTGSLILLFLNLYLIRYECPYLIKYFDIRNIFIKNDFFLSFTIPAFLAGIMFGPVNWISNTILAHQENGYSELGIFNAANQWRMAVMFLPSVIGRIVLPLLSNTLGKSQRDYLKILKLNLLANGLATLLLSLLIALMSSQIMNAYGSTFSSGSVVLIILVLTTIPISLNDVIGQAIASQGQMWIGFSFNLAWAIVLLSSFSLLREFGALGLALSYLIAYIFHTVVQGFFVWNKLSTNKFIFYNSK